MVKKGSKTPITPAQVRAARGWLGWTQQDLERHSRVAKRTIARYEQETTVPYMTTLEELQSALERAGITFVFEDAQGAGIRADMKARGPLKRELKRGASHRAR